MPQSQFHENKIYVIGHKNPDTDSICSAISYAWLKNLLLERESVQSKNSSTQAENQAVTETAALRYVPMRAGHVNQETAYVLDYFKVPEPDYITDVEPQVKDIAIKEVKGIHEMASLRDAYTSMREQETVTLPVIDDAKQLRGVITINDIA